MKTWLWIITVPLALLLVSSCVATGSKEITQPALTDRLEEGKSTKAEVTGLLGFPAIVTYGPEGQETWDYYYLTEYPQAGQFFPVVAAVAPEFQQNAKVLTVTFDRKGVAQSLARRQTTGPAALYPY